MNAPKPTKLLLRSLRRETTARPPFWLMRQAGRHLAEYRQLRVREPDFLRFCYSPDLAIEAALQPIRRYGCDGAILFSDILVVPDALGRKVRFEEKIGPVLDPIRGPGDIPRYERRSLLAHLAPVFETVAGLGRALPAETTLIGFAGAPWTVAVYMVEGRGGTDHGKVIGWAYKAPDEFGRLIGILTEATADYLLAQIEAGAEAVQVFDSWAGILSEEQYRRWVIAPTAAIVDRLKAAAPRVPIIGFPRASGVLFQAYAEETGVDAVGIDSAVPLAWARDVLQKRVAVQGNLDNRLLAAGGAAMEAEIERLLDTLGAGPFVFNLGHGILPSTPAENVDRLAEMVRGWKGR